MLLSPVSIGRNFQAIPGKTSPGRVSACSRPNHRIAVVADSATKWDKSKVRERLKSTRVIHQIAGALPDNINDLSLNRILSIFVYSHPKLAPRPDRDYGVEVIRVLNPAARLQNRTYKPLGGTSANGSASFR